MQSDTTNTNENIKVYVRVRPRLERERDGHAATQVAPPNSIIVTGARSDIFTYDYVGGEDITQDNVFRAVGKTIVEKCIEGYNGTIFAYGQTGSGKTYTMQGATGMGMKSFQETRGIIPRCLEYLFYIIAREEKRSQGAVKYLCRASYIEIYNECIYDLLDATLPPRAIREDIKRGIYVDGVTEESISTPEDAYKLFEQGVMNRHVSSTAMNRESSRSHSVLTLTIQSKTISKEGITQVRESRFNLVDLAGSERQKSAATDSLRLKEAANINKSLLCLGTVINALVDIANGNPRHVHYRDSKLTFLLKDSLGGNSITYIIANVSPSNHSYAETISTLRFAQRAKMIKNKAIVNQDVQGNVYQLRDEIKRLKHELQSAKGLSSSDHSALTPGVSDVTTMRNLVAFALQNQQKAEAEREMHLRRIDLLEDHIRRKDEQIQSQNLILKFRQETIHALESNYPSHEVFEKQKNMLHEEISFLRSQLDHHPDVTRLAAESLQLKSDMKEYEKHYGFSRKDFDRERAQTAKYHRELAQQILALVAENDQLRKHLSAIRNSGDNEEAFAAFDALKEQLDAADKYIRELEADKEKKSAEYMNLKEQCQHLETQIAELKHAETLLMSELGTARDADSRQMSLAREEIDSLRRQCTRVTDLKKQLEQDIEAIQSSRDEALMQLESEKTQAEQMKADLLQEKSDLDAEIFRLSNELHTKEVEAEQLLSKTQNLEVQLEDINDEVNYYKKESEDMKANNSKLISENESALESIQKLQSSNGELTQQTEQLKSLLREMPEKQEYTNALNQVAQLNASLTEKGNEISRLFKDLSDTQRDLEASSERLAELEAELEKEKAASGDILAQLKSEKQKNSNLLSEKQRLELENDNNLRRLEASTHITNFEYKLMIHLQERNSGSGIDSSQSMDTEESGQSRDEEISELKEVIRALENNVSSINHEKANLNMSMRRQQDQVADMKAELDRMLIYQQKYRELKTEYLNLRNNPPNALTPVAQPGPLQNVAQLQRKINEYELQIQKLEFNLKMSQDVNEDLMRQLDHSGEVLAVSGNGHSRRRSEEFEKTISKLKTDMDKLGKENARLLQHQNQRQKIQYHLEIKQENNQLRLQIAKLNARITAMESNHERSHKSDSVLAKRKAIAAANKGVK